uniref:Putative pheromone binding protein 3 n=1 Tax=Corcyra cephalonica TaxID=139036 RepID=A0A8K1P993_CORCP|nr:putative pheromone binding protein 3 [Corcyra cephalonica]
MKKLSIGFIKTLDTCKKELNVGENVMQEMQNFWREEYDLVHRDTGCMILCMATKHDLLHIEEYKLHHAKSEDFAKTHGADEDTAKQLVAMLHECEKQNEAQNDYCMRALDVAKCFRTKIHGLKWAPTMEDILEEIMIEV